MRCWRCCNVLFQISVNTLRQKEQQLIKDAFEKTGIKLELKLVDQTVFFSTGAGQTDNYPRFYTDLEMYTNSPVLPDSQNCLRRFVSSDVCQKANNWGGTNVTRDQNKALDDLYNQALVELDPDKRGQIFVQMNDLSVSDVIEIPIVFRTGAVAMGKTLKWAQNSTWDSNLWNTADWTKRSRLPLSFTSGALRRDITRPRLPGRQVCSRTPAIPDRARRPLARSRHACSAPRRRPGSACYGCRH